MAKVSDGDLKSIPGVEKIEQNLHHIWIEIVLNNKLEVSAGLARL